MRMLRLSRALVARRLRDRDRGSLPMVLLAILLGMTLSAGLIPIIVNQSTSTRDDTDRMLALDAAQSGLQIELGRLRAATTNSTGDITLLPPCGGSGALGGSLGDGEAAYKVQVDYYDADPRSHLLDSAWKLANQLPCVVNGSTGAVTTTPAYASLTAYGTTSPTKDFTDTTQSRTLTATYVFRTNNQNFAGGQLVYGSAGGTSLCIDAGSATPTAGAAVTMQPCDPKVPDQQKFSYRNNLSILLNSSISTQNPLGLCLQPALRQLGAAPQSGDVIELQTCVTDATSTTSDPLYFQQWSFNDSSQFQSANSATTLGSLYMSPATSNTAGSQLTIQGSGVGWLPTSAVGAGMAGPSTNQLVNYAQFGRCLDLQSWILSNPFINWPCKQTPSGVAGWNQRIAYNSVSHTLSIDYYTSNGTVENPGQPYCAVVPSTTSTGAALRIMVTPCSNPYGLDITWYEHTEKSKWTYADLYSISNTPGATQDGGWCMAPSTTDIYQSSNGVGYVVLAKCDGSLIQKWNADPNVLQALPLKDTQEK